MLWSVLNVMFGVCSPTFAPLLTVRLQLLSDASAADFLKVYRERFNTFSQGLEYTDKGFSYLYREVSEQARINITCAVELSPYQVRVLISAPSKKKYTAQF